MWKLGEVGDLREKGCTERSGVMRGPKGDLRQWRERALSRSEGGLVTGRIRDLGCMQGCRVACGVVCVLYAGRGCTYGQILRGWL